jgi:hypothetical protein
MASIATSAAAQGAQDQDNEHDAGGPAQRSKKSAQRGLPAGNKQQHCFDHDRRGRQP